MAKNSDLKVLVLAEAANPEWTSVPLVGWSHTLALSRKVHVHLVTQVRNRAAIERFGWKHGREFTALNTEKVAAPIHKLANLIRGGSKLAWTVSTAFQSLIYPYFEYLCWKTFEKDLRAGKFDIVHRITPVSPTAPSYLAKRLKKIKIPFVVGPMNGGVEWPVQFREVKGKEKEWLTNFRDFYKVLPGYRSMRAASAALIAGSKATLAQLPAYTREKSLLIPENAIDPDRFSIQNQSTYALPLKAAFVGRLVPYKGADMAIEAMEPLLLAKKIEYDIYGAGPEENRLRQMVAAKGLTGSVRVHGQVPHTE
ncbi:MAG TPA: glycosyltransferase, partial [Cellvibrio sp.]|nr:glycosyltransferase [Cellvibrio sp.]